MRIDLADKRVIVAGVADDGGFGFAIAKAFAEAGAKVNVATWPPAMTVFEKLWERGKFDESRQLDRGGLLEFENVFPLDAAFDEWNDVPEEVRQSRRYAGRGDFTIQGLVDAVERAYGRNSMDVVVHCLANGSEVNRPLMDTSRKGYLGAIGASAYSNVSMVSRFAPLMRSASSFLSLSYLASERVVPLYGGGMSTAKAALECDTRYLAFEAGRRYGFRVNAISAGPYASRAASVGGLVHSIVEYYEENSPLPSRVTPTQVAHAALFLCSPLATAITGTTLHVDHGLHIMGKGVSAADLAWLGLDSRATQAATG
jgi:enoyl-[acyl-carrier protein] reductase I